MSRKRISLNNQSSPAKCPICRSSNSFENNRNNWACRICGHIINRVENQFHEPQIVINPTATPNKTKAIILIILGATFFIGSIICIVIGCIGVGGAGNFCCEIEVLLFFALGISLLINAIVFYKKYVSKYIKIE
jgi:hypothetical protein